MNLGEVFHELVRQKENKVLEDHLQMLLIPPKYSVAQVVGYMKGKSAIHIARNYLGQRKNYSGMHFWARGYFVSTLVPMKTLCRSISTIRKKKTSVLNTYRYLKKVDRPPSGGQRNFLTYSFEQPLFFFRPPAYLLIFAKKFSKKGGYASEGQIIPIRPPGKRWSYGAPVAWQGTSLP